MQIEIQARGFQLTEAIEGHVRRRLQFALDWGRHAIRRVKVRLTDENGPRGGLDKRCSVVVVLSGLPDVVIEDTRDDIYRAVDSAADRLGRNLARKLERTRKHHHHAPALVGG